MAWSDAARAAAARARRMKVKFSAQLGGKKIKAVYNLKTGDKYAAMDMIAKKIGVKRYEQLTNKVFLFGTPRLKMNRKLAQIIKNAGPEEDE